MSPLLAFSNPAATVTWDGGSADLATSPLITVGSNAVFSVAGLAAPLTLPDGQTLKGGGLVEGALIAGPGSRIEPGLSPGALSVAGSLTMQSNSTLAVEIASLTSYDQLAFTSGGLTLNDATLDIALTYTPSVGSVFTIVSGASSIVGEFAGKPHGSQFNDGADFEISYGSNDITLKVIPEPATLALLVLGGAAALAGAWRRRRAREDEDEEEDGDRASA
jgi:hypothetical protein